MQNLTKSELIAELEKVKQREEHYRILLDDSSDPIFSFDRKGQYLYVNRQFTQCVCNEFTPRRGDRQNPLGSLPKGGGRQTLFNR